MKTSGIKLYNQQADITSDITTSFIPHICITENAFNMIAKCMNVWIWKMQNIRINAINEIFKGFIQYSLLALPLESEWMKMKNWLKNSYKSKYNIFEENEQKKLIPIQFLPFILIYWSTLSFSGFLFSIPSLDAIGYVMYTKIYILSQQRAMLWRNQFVHPSGPSTSNSEERKDEIYTVYQHITQIKWINEWMIKWCTYVHMSAWSTYI